MTFDLLRRVAAEFVGSLILAGVVIGSGVMAQRLAGGNDAIALLGNTLATATVLYVLISALAPISGAHFNPAVTLVAMLRRELSRTEAFAFVAVQVVGCVAGAVLAHAMFELPLVQLGTIERAGAGQWLSEAVATFALVACIILVSRFKPNAIAPAVACAIAAGYWWTASTSFANPAITVARSLTDTFSGIAPADVAGFIGAQMLGALAAAWIVSWIIKSPENMS